MPYFDGDVCLVVIVGLSKYVSQGGKKKGVGLQCNSVVQFLILGEENSDMC